MDPSPTPSVTGEPTVAPIIDSTDLANVTGIFAAIAIVSLAVTVGIFVLAMLRAARYPHPVPLIVALSLLTLVSISGYVLTEYSELITVGATGIGALAGAVTAVYTKDATPAPGPGDEDRSGGKHE